MSVAVPTAKVVDRLAAVALARELGGLAGSELELVFLEEEVNCMVYAASLAARGAMAC